MPSKAGKKKGNAKKKDDEAIDAEFAAKCEKFRLYYSALGKEEWWWIMDDVQEAMGVQLNSQGYCVIDGFLTQDQAKQMRKEVAECHTAGRLEAGGLVNGKLPSADDAKYADRATRGDVIGWFDSGKEEWPHGKGLEGYLLKLGTLVSELAKPVPEMANITSRSKAMAACYPGGGARYIKHVDNDGKHPLCKTRLLTALIYLNDGWQEGDGGELAIFRSDDQDVVRRVVQPLGNRLLLFWSDWRTPHEVRPTNKLRYSVTIWLLDNTQKAAVDAEAQESETPSVAPPPEPSKEASAAPPPSIDINASSEVRYEWRPAESSDGAQAWELKVELPEPGSAESAAAAPECPLLELSEAQVRVLSAASKPLLCLPLPSWSTGPPVSKWSRKKRLLSARFESPPQEPSAALPASASQAFAEQLRSRGWGTIDGFLPGPEADALRQFVYAMRAEGHLSVGKNAHEGPTGTKAGGGRSRDAMKNDEYTFLDGSGSSSSSAPVKDLARRCNRLLAGLVAPSAGGLAVEELKGKKLLQGHPMLAVYPGNGAAYGRHLDSTDGGRGANGRVLTLIVYLNPFWREEHGGSLRLLENLADEGSSGNDVEPLHGRLVAFLCKDRNPHEVLSSWADRAAVTIWYYDGDRLSQRCMGDEASFAGVFEGG